MDSSRKMERNIMKIAIDARVINTTGKHGIFTYTNHLVHELAKLDVSNQYSLLYTSLKRKADELPGPKAANFQNSVIRIPDRNFPVRDWLFSKVFLPAKLRELHCDVFHSTYDNIPLNTNGIKYVLTVHDLKSCVIQDGTWEQDLKQIGSAVKCADVIIAVSRSTKNDLMKYFNVPETKINVVYEGVDEIFRKIEDQDKVRKVCARYGLTGRYFMTMGSVPRKNIERLIMAYADFKYKESVSLVLGGVGSEGPRFEKYNAVVEQYGIAPHVKFLGYIKDDQDLVHLYNGAECFLFPSLYEGFGLPVLEAMACGVAVITSNISSLPEVGGDAAIYVDPHQESTITQAMNKIVEEPKLGQELAKKGLEQVKKFTWRKMAEETLAIYKNINS